MKRILGLIALFTCLSMTAHAGTCGSGVTCGSVVLQMTNANASTAGTILPLYTAPSGGNGAKIIAVLGSTTITAGSSSSAYNIYITHGSVSTALNQGSLYPGGTGQALNMLTQAFAATYAEPAWPVDENGNVFIFLAPGDTLAISNYVGITSSGSTGGVSTFTAFYQSY